MYIYMYIYIYIRDRDGGLEFEGAAGGARGLSFAPPGPLTPYTTPYVLYICVYIYGGVIETEGSSVRVLRLVLEGSLSLHQVFITLKPRVE